MKKSSVAVAGIIALVCVWQAFLSPDAVRIDAHTGAVDHGPHLWPLLLAAIATITVAALLADFIILSALCAFIILILSLISFFSIGLLVSGPAGILVILIGLDSRRMPSLR